MHEIIIAKFMELGLTRNEALAYVTLLEDGETGGLTGYEVAARSGIPRSAVYTVLRKLQDTGAAFCLGSEPARYTATDPATFVATMRRTLVAQLEGLSDSLEKLPKRSRPEPVWILHRYEDVMARIETMIRSAERSVYLSIWPRELARIEPILAAVTERGLHRVLYSPASDMACPAGFSCWIDSVIGDEAKAAWSHKALVVVDHREALIGGTEPLADNQAVWTTNPSLVDTATNGIIMDITLLARSRGVDCTDVVSPMMRPHLDPRETPQG
ncbi:MAG: helix-turn-helix domain-containing protein [Pseudomonadota bacterium]